MPPRFAIVGTMKSFIKEFKTFALRGNALDLAIGVVIGAAFTAITNSVVTDLLTPPIGLLIGGVDFSDLMIPLGEGVGVMYGHFIEVTINFVITAFALFLLVRFINKFLRKAQEEPKAEPVKTPEVLLLEEIRDLLKK